MRAPATPRSSTATTWIWWRRPRKSCWRCATATPRRWPAATACATSASSRRRPSGGCPRWRSGAATCARWTPTSTSDHVSGLADWVAGHGYLLVFVTVTLELVGVPFPSETILIGAGAAAATGTLELPVVMAVAMVAAVLGACGGYAIGRVGGRPLLDRLVARGWPRQQQLVRVEQFFGRHGG